MSKRFPYDEVSEFFKAHNCVLLSPEYKNNSSILDFICSCGNKDKVAFSNFKQGQRCKECGLNLKRSKLSLNYFDVRAYFEENNCVLISKEYVNANTKLVYICVCGEKNSITFGNFSSGRRCKKCGTNKTNEKNRRTLEEIKNIFKERECILLADEYVNNKQELLYICKCGDTSKIRLDNFLNGNDCRQCGFEKNKYSYEYVKKYFEDSGCTLISGTYEGIDEKLDYICVCKRHSNISFSAFKQGQRCMSCRNEKMSGSNCKFWNGGTTEINAYLRGVITFWKKDTLIKDNFKCVISNHSGKLDIHHLYSFNKIVKETFEKIGLEIKVNICDYTDLELKLISNEFAERHTELLGVCLLPSIHSFYHFLYGTDNTPEQFDEFKMRYEFGEFKDVV